jgi:hypothetical protein
MTRWFLLGGAVLVSAIATYLFARRDADQLSQSWHTDNDRRQWTQGIDGPSVKFPINKMANEASEFNRSRLRRRA